MQGWALRPAFLLRVGIATQRPRSFRTRSLGPHRNIYFRPPSSPLLRRFSSSQQTPREDYASPEEKKKSTTNTISSALHNVDPSKNDLLSPVYIPEDPNGVLNEKHPAVDILANSSIVVTRQMELMNIMMGFEQANKYVIMNPQGQHIGFMAETDLGMGNMLKRQMFNTHRSFTTHVFNRYGKEVLRVRLPKHETKLYN